MNSTVLKIVAMVVLGWLKTLWDRYVEKQKNLEQGRQEVKDALDRRNKEIEAEAEKLRNTDPTFDDALSRMRDRLHRS